MTKEAPWMDIALGYLGQKEIPGSADNPVIIKFYAEAGHPEIKDESTAWCSAFVNAVLYEYGITGTKNLLARSWLKWSGGESVSIPRYGDVAVFQRGNDPVFGHVAFFEKWDSNYVYVLGGNQSDAVTRTRMPRGKLLGFRRPKVKDSGSTTRVPAMSQAVPPKVEPSDMIMGAGGVVAAVEKDWLVAVIFLIALGGLVGYRLWNHRK